MARFTMSQPSNRRSKLKYTTQDHGGEQDSDQPLEPALRPSSLPEQFVSRSCLSSRLV